MTKDNKRILNPKILETLNKAIDKANLPGEDYHELAQAVEAMKNLPFDEEAKLKSALAALSTKGLTIKKVLESADYYLEVLDNEKRKFYNAFENKIKGSVKANKNKIINLKDLISEKSKKITDLKDLINNKYDEIKKLEEEIDVSDEKIKEIEDSFLYTYEKVVSKIKEDIVKINALKQK